MLTIAGIAAAAHWGLGMSLGLALVLGAALAPTDPVLASDVQLRSPHDRDNLRFALTGEGGLNDGTAFPFIFLGLGLLGLHDIGAFGWRWVVIDLAWGTIGGLGIGFAIGAGVARGVRALRQWRKRRRHLRRVPVVRSHRTQLRGCAGGAHAGLSRGVCRRPGAAPRGRHSCRDSAGSTEHSPLTPSMLSVNEQLERIVEVAVVLLVGAMISTGYWSLAGLALAALLFLVIRPLSVWLGVWGEAKGTAPRRLLAWFGIRGIGSVYYAVYVAAHDLRYARRRRAAVLRLYRDRRLHRRSRRIGVAAHGAVSAAPGARPSGARPDVGQTMTGLPRALPRHWR